MRGTILKTGDIFSIRLENNTKKYFQYVTKDLTQLNSDVIRVFENKYSIDTSPHISEIVKDEIALYAHCSIMLGIKMNLWEKVGNDERRIDFGDVQFRDTNDYGHKLSNEPIRISKNWHVWKINDKEFKKMGRLEGNYKKSFIGLVFNPLGVVELAKGNKYPINYPDYE